MKKRVFNIVGHDILEYNNLKLFSTLGYEVFTPSVYMDPKNPDPTKPYLPNLDLNVNKEILDEFLRLNLGGYRYPNKLKISKSFIDKFDIILVSWIKDVLIDEEDWKLIKDKLVIYQSLGQSSKGREYRIAKWRAEKGIKIVRISDKERNFPLYGGEDAIIDLDIDCNYYTGWVGNDSSVLTINSSVFQRSLACNSNQYLEVVNKFNKKLYGTGNDPSAASFIKGTASKEELLAELITCRAFFSLGTKPCPVVLSFKEAMSTGIPVVTWGPRLGGPTYAACDYIENGVNGFYSDNLEELKSYLRLLLNDYEFSKSISINSRKTAIEHFSTEVISKKWESNIKEWLNG